MENAGYISYPQARICRGCVKLRNMRRCDADTWRGQSAGSYAEDSKMSWITVPPAANIPVVGLALKTPSYPNSASVYSANEAAWEEFPDLDLTTLNAIQLFVKHVVCQDIFC